MERLTPDPVLPTLVLGLIMVAAIPALAIFLTVGWAWRLWNATTTRVMSFVFHQHTIAQLRVRFSRAR